MSKLPAGNKGQRGRAPRPAGALQTPGGTRTAGSGQEQQGEPGLSEAMAATVTDSGGVRIITEVIPATDPRAAQLASSSVPPAPAVSSFQVRGFRKAQPKLLGTIHIVTGIIHFCFGIILTAAEHRDLSLPVASGILFWLGVLLLVSGSLLVESDKRENILLVKACCVVNVGVILSTLVATLIHAAAITRSIPGCDGGAPYQLRQEWCFNANTKVLSNALDAVAVLFCLLEFCAAVAALAFGCAAVRRHSYTRMAL
ncbi:membrane-spanning 4-domains subfamily A member 15-like isoform X4 [Oxyura jamaicensis]|uniref:membrane-spanning 4-domains subfamily A member 15-like isoform X4 n=1 Tax=Oxyura jamaicensis TaxID=8884 RepID=UPI0015A6B879|nr:membrane-spanning 4-domains subfamily A member 15-like isoform X4 [Oxyura jamaicensis]